MTLSRTNPASYIRPLGEEHLRMFRKTIGSTPETSTHIRLPLKSKKEPLPKVSLMNDGGTFREMKGWALAADCRIATLSEAIMDMDFLRSMASSGKGPIFVERDSLPLKEGYYRVDRKLQQLKKIRPEDVGKFETFDVLHISGSASNAAREGGWPLLLGVHVSLYEHGLFVGEIKNPDIVAGAAVARLKKG